MFVDDVKTSAEHQLNQIIHTLKHVHGVELNFSESTVEQVQAVRDSSEIVKNSIVSESAFNSWHNDPNYAKHMLILEAVRIYLNEIAPKRRPKAVKESIEHPHHRKVTKIGQWMMDFAQNNNSNDEKILNTLNSFSRVGEDLTHVGAPFGPSTFKELLAGYENRANSESNDSFDRKQARDNLSALRIGIKLYDKHHRKPAVDEVVLGPDDQKSMPTPNVNTGKAVDTFKSGMGDPAQGQILKPEKDEPSGDLKGLMKQYGVNERRSSEVRESKDDALSKLDESHMQHHDYQASMARAELYRNSKYAVDMLKMIRKEDDIEPWIAAALTKSAMYLDKIYHYLDYYTKFESGELSEEMNAPDFETVDDDSELGETTGSVARENLMMITEYSMKLFNMIQPGDKLEGWVAMKLTTASECISSSKHFLDYKHFERHAGDHFDLHESLQVAEAPTRKDFRMVAKMINSHPDAEAREMLAKHHADIYAQQNPRFDRDRFMKAATTTKEGPVKKTQKRVSEGAGSPEQDLEQAQTLIAAKSLSDDLQTMAEKVARMAVDDLMPLVDTMKSQFGPEAADGYNATVKAQLDQLLAAVQKAKDESDNAVSALQQGGVPSAPTDIGSPEMAPPAGDELGDDDLGDGLGTTPAAAGGEEPLGRAKKPLPGGEEPTDDDLGLAESRKRVSEKWDAKMKTAEKDKGKWDGWTLAKLKAHKKKLMDKETRTAAEQKEVKQIDFAIRAKQKDKWGKVDEAKSKPDFLDVDKDGNKKEPMKKALKDKEKTEEMFSYKGKGSSKSQDVLGRRPAGGVAKHGEEYKDVMTGRKGQLHFSGDRTPYSDEELTAMQKRAGVGRGMGGPKGTLPEEMTDEGNEFSGALAAAKAAGKEEFEVGGKTYKVKEAKSKSPYAIGMWQAKKAAGLDPDKPAHDLPKKVIKKAHKIGASIEGTDESIAHLKELQDKAVRGRRVLQKELAEHREQFSKRVMEGRTQDPLKVGQGIEGDLIEKKIQSVSKMINDLGARINETKQASLDKLRAVIEQEEKEYRFEKIKNKSPYGVMFESADGKRDYRFFHDQKARDYWVQLNGDENTSLIGPEHFDIAVSK
jgi:hypothetical protein